MRFARACAALAATVMASLAGMAEAQQFPPPPPTAPTVQERWPDPPKTPAQRSPTPAAAPRPAAQQTQTATPPAQTATPPAQEEPLQEAQPKPAAKPKPKPAAHPVTAGVVACSGVFAKDTSHLKLAIKYDSRNVTFGQVDGPNGANIPASILFPNDPRRRLEVLWNNPAGRTDLQVIAINGKSQWSAPKGLKLGLTIAALQKLNGRPFKISGFGADGAASVLGWEGGSLTSLPGGCKVGMRLFADPKAPEEARSEVAGDKELMSNEPGIVALKPTVGEILIGY